MATMLKDMAKEALVEGASKVDDVLTSKTVFSDSLTPLHIIFGIKKLSDGTKNGTDTTISDHASTCSSDHLKSVYSQQSQRCVQQISYHTGPVWCAKFSPSGEYLCTAGEDASVVVWFVGCDSFETNTSSSSRRVHSLRRESSRYALLDPTPHRVFNGHTGDVVDISWSGVHPRHSRSNTAPNNHENFILSASIDKTVRLWHVDKEECLQVFRHPDIVTSVQFCPQSDKKFVSGCFDKKIRIWEIVPDPIIRQYCAVREIITACSFTPDGTHVVCGLVNGDLITCEANNSRMSIQTVMSCRRNKGKYSEGRKVTGFCFVPKDPSMGHKRHFVKSSSGTLQEANHLHSHHRLSVSSPTSMVTSVHLHHHIASQAHTQSLGKYYLLVTTNDHRIRLINLEDRSVVCKYMGHRNDHLLIRAQASECGRLIISGSDDGQVHVWKRCQHDLESRSNNEYGENEESISPRKADIAKPKAGASAWLTSLFVRSSSSGTRRQVNCKPQHFNGNTVQPCSDDAATQSTFSSLSTTLKAATTASPTVIASFVPANAIIWACKHNVELQRLSDFPSFLNELNKVNMFPFSASCNKLDSCNDTSEVDHHNENLNFISKVILVITYDGTIKVFAGGVA